MRAHGTPAVDTAGKAVTLSVTITSGRTSSQISSIRSWAYLAPSASSAQIGMVTVSSCSMVGLRNSGAVVADELRPALAHLLLVLGRRRHPHQGLLEAALLELALERLLDDEHHADPALAQVVAHRDEVVGGSPGARLGEECDRGLLVHAASVTEARPNPD